MSHAPPPGARTSPSTARNREPILQVLAPRLAPGARVLEIASGAGEHAVFLARALPHVHWQPTDRDPEARASIAAWRDAAALPNLAAPLALDAADPAAWPVGPIDAVVCINMIHISPWAATEGLMAGAADRLPPAGRLFCYGPFLERDVPTAPTNTAFDASLRTRDPAWGLRQVEAVTALAERRRLHLDARIEMPANNLMLVFAKA
jgi:SAM-dependent methyltransferase